MLGMFGRTGICEVNLQVIRGIHVLIGAWNTRQCENVKTQKEGQDFAHLFNSSDGCAKV